MQGRSYSVERNFGILVGGVLAAMGGWWLIRGKFHSIAPWALGLGALLVILGVSFPRVLVTPNRLWMKLAEALSFVMTHVILGLVFFLVVMPTGLVRRMLGGDPLNRRALPAESYWKPYLARQTDPRHYEKMY
jgi:saxitoxin biosynthesis operon SxtJ-like protein